MTLADVKQRLRRLDPYVTRGVKSQYREGMRRFWWYGFLIAAASAFADSYVTLYALSLGATSLQIGTLSSARSFLAMLAPIPGAQWAAKWGKRKAVVLISFGVRRVALLGAILAPVFFKGEAVINVAIACFALRAGLVNLGSPAWTSLSGDIVPENRRGRYFASRKMVMALASMLCVPLAGQLIEWLGAPQGYQIAFGIAIVLGAVALFTYSKIPEPEMAKPVNTSKGARALWDALTSSRAFLLFCLTSIVWNLAWQIGGPYFSVYQVDVLKATPRIIGLLSTAGALVRMIAQPFWGRIIDRRGARWTRAVCTLIIPFLPLGWIPMTRAWHALFVTLPSSFMWSGYQTANFNLQLELPSQAHRTHAVATYTTLIGIANAIGPLIGGQIVERAGFHFDFIVSGAGRMVGALLFVWALKPFAKQRKEEKATTF